MLDISFYSETTKILEPVECSEELYSWLAESEFSKIGKSEEIEIEVDEEPVKYSGIFLKGESRRKFSIFFRDAIVKESDDMLNKLGNSPSKDEYFTNSRRLIFLQELRKLVEDEKFKYLIKE